MPIDLVQTLIFLSQPLLFLIPFLLIVSIPGTYLLSKVWMKDVVINLVTKQFGEEKLIQTFKHLSANEKHVLHKIIEHSGKLHQNDLTKETGLARHKISRIMNKLESLGLIIRERDGMTNLIQTNFDVNLISNL